MGQAAQSRADREHEDADVEDFRLAEDVAEAAEDENDGGNGDQVDGDDPGDDARTDAELIGHGRERHVDNAAVERAHEYDDIDKDQDDPSAFMRAVGNG